MNKNIDFEWMDLALRLAQQAESQNEVPVGALIVCEDQVIAKGWNRPIGDCDPTSHAEIVTLRQAAQYFKNYRLPKTTLYVTLEPCAMCLGAMIQARVDRLVFGAFDSRAGAVQSVFQIGDEKRLNHRIEWTGGVLEKECQEILQNFFRMRRVKVTQ